MSDPKFETLMAPGGDPRLTCVVHVKAEGYDVYIGRPGPYGNPYFIGDGATREEVIGKFYNYIQGLNIPLDHNGKTPKGRDQLLELVKSGALSGKRLGCFCRPNACHGDVLVELDRHQNGCAFTLNVEDRVDGSSAMDRCNAPSEYVQSEQRRLCPEHKELVKAEKWKRFTE